MLLVTTNNEGSVVMFSLLLVTDTSENARSDGELICQSYGLLPTTSGHDKDDVANRSHSTLFEQAMKEMKAASILTISSDPAAPSLASVA